jgi:hypothetical protein
MRKYLILNDINLPKIAIKSYKIEPMIFILILIIIIYYYRYDFNSDGLITREDIRLILSYIPYNRGAKNYGSFSD